MFQYEVDGQLYEVPQDMLDKFMSKYPNAKKVEGNDPGKKLTPSKKGATAGSKTQAPDMDSNLEDGSSESQNKIVKISRNGKTQIYSYDEVKKLYGNVDDYVRKFKGQAQIIEQAPEVVLEGPKKQGLTEQQMAAVSEEAKRKAVLGGVSAATGMPGFVASGTTSIAKGALDLVSGLLKVAEKDLVATPYAMAKSLFTDNDSSEEAFAKNLRQYYKEESPELITDISKTLSTLSVKKYDEAGNQLQFTDLVSSGRYKDAAELTIDQTLGAAPSLVVSYMFPSIGGAMLGLSSVGNNFEEDLENRPDATLTQIQFASILKGAEEWGTEWAGGRLFKAISGLKASGAAEETIKEFTANYYGTFLKKSILGGSGEFVTEGLTDVANQLTDSAIYGDELSTKNLFRGFINNGISGLFLGAGATGAASAINFKPTVENKTRIYQSVAPKQWQVEQLNIGKKIYDTQKDLEAAPENKKDFFKKKLDNLREQKAEREKELYDIFEGKTRQEKLQYAKNLDAATENLDILNNPKYSKEAQDEARKVIYDSYKANEEALPLKGFDAAIETIISTRLKAAEKIAERTNIANGIGKDDLAIENVNSKQVKELGYNENADAFIITTDGKPTLYINTDIAPATEQTNVIGHELLHYLISKNFKLNSPQLKQSIESFKTYLKDNHTEIYNRVEARIKANYADNNGVVPDNAQEEYLNVFSDLISQEKILPEERGLASVKSNFERLLQGFGFKAAKFETGEDVFNFLKNYSKNVNSKNKLLANRAVGVKLLNKDLTVNEKSKEIKVNYSASLQSKLDELEEQYMNQEIDYETYIAKAEALESTIVEEAAPKVKPEKVDTKTAEKELSAIAIKANKIYEEGVAGIERNQYSNKNPLPAALENKLLPIFNGYINTVVRSKFKQTEEEAIEYQDAISILQTAALRGIREFNPNKNKDITGYVKRIIAYEIPRIFADVNKEFASDIEEQTGLIYEESAPAKTERLLSGTSFTKVVTEIYNELGNKAVTDKINEVVENYITSPDALKKLGFKKAGSSIIIEPEEMQAFKKMLEESFIKEYSKEFQKSVVAPAKTDIYENLIERSFELYKLIPQSFINKKINAWAEPDIDPKTGKQKRESVATAGKYGGAKGNPLFKKKAITKQEWVEYWMAPGKGASTQAALKQRFAELLAQEMGKDAFLVYLNDPAARAKFVDQQRMPAIDEITGLGATLATALDRDPQALDVRYSLSSIKNLSDKTKQNIFDRSPVFAQALWMGDTIHQAVEEAFGDFLQESVRLSIADELTQLSLNFDKNQTKKFKEIRAKYGDNKQGFINDKIFESLEATAGIAQMLDLKSNPRGFYDTHIFKSGKRGINPNSTRITDANIALREEFKLYVDEIIAANDIDGLSSFIQNYYKIFSNGTANKLFNNNNEILNYFNLGEFFELNSKNAIVYKKNFNNNIKKGQQVYRKPNSNDKAKSDLINDITKGTDTLKDSLIGFNENGAQFTRDFLSIVDFLVKSQASKETVALVINGLNASQTSSVRSLPKLESFVSYDGMSLNHKDWVYEHIPPISHMLRATINYITDPTTENYEFLTELISNSRAALVPKDFANAVDKKYKSTMPLFWRNGLNVYSRYAEFAKEFPGFKITEIATGKEINYSDKNVKYSVSLNKDFSQMLERVSGIPAKEKISLIKAKKLSEGKQKWHLWISPQADDMHGLLDYNIGKGKQGNEDRKWIQDNFFKPYAEANRNYDTAKQGAILAYKNLLKGIKTKGLDLKTKTNSIFTNEELVRLYIWDKSGYLADDQAIKKLGLEKSDVIEMRKYMRKSKDLREFAENVFSITNKKGFPTPEKNWEKGSLQIDLIDYSNTLLREEVFRDWNESADQIFDSNVLNKLRAIHGENYVEAIEDALYRMKSGRHRVKGSNKEANGLLNWVNDAVGTTMFLNTRSVTLQMISFTNFINLEDNNPIAIAKLLATQPKQVYTDVLYLFNSDFLKQRRGGLKIDVNVDEIATAASESRNPVRAMISGLLKIGFTPTQIADSFAISLGGSTFYRNRINKYVAQGFDVKEAESKAFIDFQEEANKSQQSSRPDRISMQQASNLGRVVLAWANTPMQYARIIKGATLDLINGRGSWQTNIGRIVYYGALQNIIFTSLQSAMFALMFDDEEDEKDKGKYYTAANNTVDSILRGFGYYGAIASTAKNIILEVVMQSQSNRPDYQKAAAKITTLSPPLDSKIRKAASIGRTFTWKQEREKMRSEGFSLDNPIFYAGGQAISLTTNIPVDRIISKLDNLTYWTRHDVETWQAIGLGLGWTPYDLGIEENKKEKPEKEKKTERRISKKRF